MNVLFMVLSVILLAYMIKRPLDFFSVAAVCLVIYNYYCAIGTVFISARVAGEGHLYDGEVLPEVYFIVCAQIVIMLLVMIYYDHTKEIRIVQMADSEVYSGKDLSILFAIMGAISMAIMMSNVFTIGVKNLSAAKSEVWAQTNFLYVTGLWIAMAVFAYAMKTRTYLLFLISVPQVLIHLYIGSRAYFAVICILALVYYGDVIKGSFRKNLRLYILGAVMVFLIMIYKKIFTAVKAGDIEKIIKVLTDPDTYAWVLRWGEPRIVLSNLNFIVEKNIRLTADDLWIRIIGLVPFLDEFVSVEGTRYMSTVLRTEMNASYGLASNMWGEFFAAGSYPCVFIMYALWLKMLAWGNRLVRESGWQSFFIVPLIAYYSYYLHRMDFAKAFGNAKMVVMAMLVFFVGSCILKHRKGMRLGSGVMVIWKQKKAG